MNSPRYARIAAKLLGRDLPIVPAPAEATRARAIAHIELALAQKARRKKRMRTLGAFGLVAASCAAVFGYRLRTERAAKPVQNAAPIVATLQPMGSGAQLFTAAGSEQLHGGSALPLGGRLIANPAGGASLQLSTGTQIGIEQDSNLIFSDAGPTERFQLSAGSIHAHVAKLRPGERFIVATPDAEIEVRGTQFVLRVVAADPSCGGGSLTRVAVSEGVVEVRARGGSALVHPGEAWPAGCAEGSAPATANPSTKPEASAGSPVVRAARTTASTSPATASAAAARPAESSSLAEQNDLFAAGMAARRRGDSRAAVAKFQELLTRYPASALSESASAELMRAEATLDRASASRLAREYLQRFPDGFARRDAQAILAP